MIYEVALWESFSTGIERDNISMPVLSEIDASCSQVALSLAMQFAQIDKCEHVAIVDLMTRTIERYDHVVSGHVQNQRGQAKQVRLKLSLKRKRKRKRSNYGKTVKH